MSRRILIIGGSAAGPKVASKARRLDQKAEITIIQKSAYLSMASCGYPYYVGGVFDDRNMLIATPTGAPRDPSFFGNVKDIRAIVKTEAKRIDREKKIVYTENIETGEKDEYPYDKLVITTGATEIMPDLPGKDLRGIETLHTMEDADALKSAASDEAVTSVVIVGGGLIGIETCEALQLAGKKITVVEMRNQILPFLDWELAKLVENYIRSKGVEVITGAAVKAFLGSGSNISGVRLSDGREISCELAVVSIGVRPNSGLAKDAGIQIGATGGIAVNRFMQTSDPDIYAAGDCVEVTNLVTREKQRWPMGDTANLQGRVAAQNVVLGNVEEFEGIVGTGVCKIFDYEAGSTGLSETAARAEGYANVITALHAAPAAPDKPGFMGGKPIIIKMIADKTTGRFLGMQAVGLGDVSKRVAVGAMALHGRMSIADLVNLDLPYAPPFSSAIDNFIQAVHVIENKWRRNMVGISPLDVKRKLDAGDPVYLLDVRGPDEYEAMRLGRGENLIPLGKLRSSLDRLPADKSTEIIAYCTISLRGYEAACFLKSEGYANVEVMEGGLSAWPFPREK